jgi:excisionase family DNA binding protein
MSPMLVSIKEAAAALGIGRTKVYHLLAVGALDSVRLGTRRLVIWESVLRLLETSKCATADSPGRSDS